MSKAGRQEIRYLLMLVLVLLICISGCARVTGETAISPTQSEVSLDIPGIIAKQAAATKEVNSCRASVYLDIELQSGVSSEGSMSLTASMKSSIESQSQLLSSVITTAIVVAGSSKEVEQRIVASGENVYFKDSAQSQWQMKSLDKASAEKLWSEQASQLTGSKYAELMSPEGMAYGGTEKSNGHLCLVLKQTLDTSGLGDIPPELQQQLQSMPGLLPEQLGTIIENAEVSYFIDEQSYHLREFRLDAQVNQEVQGQSITGTIKQYCRYDAFNEPVSIKVPEIK